MPYCCDNNFSYQVIKKVKKVKKLDPEEKISIVNNSHGDIRSLLNIAQSKYAGYDDIRQENFEMDIGNAINGLFSSDEAKTAREFLSNADASYQDPHFRMSLEEIQRDKLNALYSRTMSSSRFDLASLSSILDILSKADIIVGRVGENRQWSLLKYIDNIIAYGLFPATHNKGIKYNQYSMSWPMMGPIFSRGRSMKSLLSEMAYETHASKSVFGSMYFPYLIRILTENKIDPT